MGKFRDWLERQEAASAAESQRLIKEAQDAADAARTRAQASRQELQEIADAARQSNGGTVPDEMVDEQLRLLDGDL